MKTLKTIMKFTGTGKLLSKIILILEISSLLVLLLLFMLLILNAESASGEKYFFEQIVDGAKELEDTDMILYCIALIMILISGIYITNCAYKYFANTVEKGTPFNRSSTDELRKLGIVTCIIPFCIQFITGIFDSIATDGVFEDSYIMDYNPVPYVTLGIMFLFLSSISRYGILVEQKEKV